MTRIFVALLAVFAICAGALGGAARAQQRIALVIGNGDYQLNPALPNPVADARLMARTLSKVGFKVFELLNANQASMKQAIADFGRALRAGGPESVGLFYYAGHGVQAQGNNYLIPIRSTIRDEADLDLVGVEARWVVRQMESARNVTNIVILDACRNNPFAGVGSGESGLARMDAPTGTFIAYATSPGGVAEDGTAGNSPFTSALATAITLPGLPIEQMFKQVRVEVLRDTDGAQTPWDSSSLVQDFQFVESRGLAVISENPAELKLWTAARDSGDVVQLALFLSAYPQSRHAEEARRQLTAAVNASGAPAAPQQTAAPEPAAKPAPPPEIELIEIAQATRSLVDYQAYLDAYPDGVFVDLVRAEIESLGKKQVKTATLAPVERILPPPTAPSAAPAPIERFTEPLADGGVEIIGRSIEMLAKGSPLFAPIEGLPEIAWKDKKCSNCHQWTRPTLCDQGKYYVANDKSLTTRKQHPYGGGFKLALRSWAGLGCRQ